MKFTRLGRLTSKRIEINEDIKDDLDNKLRVIKEKTADKPKVTITYFVQDLKKEGGRYVKVTDNVKKIDEYRQVVILENKVEIKILDIIEIEI